jgi:spore maturation protein CgeB
MLNFNKSSSILPANTICPLCENNGEETGEFQPCYKLDEFDNNSHNVLKCLNCNLHFMDPMPKSDWLDNHYRTRDLYAASSDHTEDYSNAITDKENLFRQLLLPHFPVSHILENRLAVDFGAGSGYVVKAFNNLGLDGLGLELNPNSPPKARSLFNVEVSNSNLDILKSSSVSVFSMFEVLEHMTDPIKFLQNVRSYLTHDGLLIGTVPNYLGLGRYIFGSNSSALSQPEHVIYFDVVTLKKTLIKAGFDPIFVGPRKPTQVVIGFGLRQWIFHNFGRNLFTRFISFCLSQSKKYLAYPLFNIFVERTGKLAHGLTFIARPIKTYSSI